MAEFVEFRSEEWMTELEQMEKISLFDSKEVKTIAKKRKELEYKLERRKKEKEDFLKYIQFEIDLLRIIKARREKNRIHAKKAEIEYSHINRVEKLFKQVIFRFPNDIKLWMSLFQFCGSVKHYSQVSQMLVRMLQIHSKEVDLWIYASKWELEHGTLIDSARQFLTKGLRHHPGSEDLYIELFKLELKHMEDKILEKNEKLKKNKWISDEVAGNIISGKVVEIIYTKAVKEIQGADFKIQLLNILKNYKDSTSIENLIVNDLIRYHSEDESTWNIIAKRELEGKLCDLSKLEISIKSLETDEDESEKRKLNVRKRLERSIQVFEKAVEKLNTVKMWSYYIDHCIEVNTDASVLPVLKSKLYTNALEGALNSGKLTEKHYLHWIENLMQKKCKSKKLEEVLEKGVDQYPKSFSLWFSQLRYYLATDQEEKGTQIFKESIKNIVDGAELWKLIVTYYQLKSSPKTKDTFEEGIQQGGEIALTLKPLYLEWLVASKGIIEARKVFKKPEMLFPPCLQLYRKMCQLESNQPNCSLEMIRECHELACNYFGENIDVWLDYVKWEKEKGDVVNISKIHRKALKSLNSLQVDEFLAEYNLIKTNDCDEPDEIELQILCS